MLSHEVNKFSARARKTTREGAYAPPGSRFALDENLIFQNGASVSYFYEGTPQIITQPTGTPLFWLDHNPAAKRVNIPGATNPTYTISSAQLEVENFENTLTPREYTYV